MSKELTSDYESSLDESKNWPGFCQLVQSPEGVSLNFSRVPMRTLPPRPSGCHIFPTTDSALTEAIERVAAIPNASGKRANKILLPSHITIINERATDDA